jgi:hypothetical protein
MSARETKQVRRERELDGEIDRYREAATAALDQLNWAINYLRTPKPRIAAALDRNRKFIEHSLR